MNLNIANSFQDENGSLVQDATQSKVLIFLYWQLITLIAYCLLVGFKCECWRPCLVSLGPLLVPLRPLQTWAQTSIHPQHGFAWWVRQWSTSTRRYTIDLSAGLHSETLLLTLGLDQLNVTMPNTMASLVSEHREKIYRSYFSQLTKMQVGTLKKCFEDVKYVECLTILFE